MARILVVEDSPTQAQNVRFILESAGFDVQVAVNGQKGLELVDSFSFDVVITDILMPVLSGYDLCRHIKSDAKKQSVPVILLTELNEPMDIIQGLECGADYFITKPFEPESLVGRIQRVLEQKAYQKDSKFVVGAEVSFLGKKVNISADKQQILELLIASFEEIVHKHQQLKKSKAELGAALVQVEHYSRQMESQARTSEDKYKRLMEQASDAIFLLDTAGRILEVNRSAEKIIGTPSVEIAGRSWEEFVPALALDQDRHFFQKLLGEGVLRLDNIQLKRRDESLVTVDLSASVMEIAGENVALAIARDVTQRNESEATLRESEKRFRQLAENIHQAYWMVDAKGAEMLYVSPAYETLWDRTCQSLVANPLDFLEGVHPKDQKRVREAYHREIREGIGFDEEYRIVRSDGSIRWAWDRGLPIRDASGAVVRHVGITEEITERKRSEQRRRVQITAARVLAEAISVEEAARQFLQAVCETLEWEVGELWLVDQEVNALHLIEQWHAPTFEIMPFTDASRQTAITYGAGVEGRIWAHGEPAWIPDLAKKSNFQRASIAAELGLRMACGFPIKLGKKILGIITFLSCQVQSSDDYLLAMMVAIGSQLGQFIERKRADDALRASEERFRLLVDGVKDYSLLMLDPSGQVITWNDGAQRIHGYQTEEILGRHYACFFTAEDIASGRPEKNLQQASAEGKYEEEGYRVRKDGARFSAHVVLTPLYNHLGQHLGFAKVTKDVTERKGLEDQFRQAQKMEAVGQLAGGVAHDFNNILTIISGYSEMLLRGLPLDDPSHGMIREIYKAGERAALLTRQLLAFSRKQVLETKVLDLNTIIIEAEKMLHRVIGEDIQFTTVLAPALSPVKVDPGQIEQVIMNLVVNARDAMPRGGKLTIETSKAVLDESYTQKHLEARPGRYVMMAVSDTGIGMDDATKSRIFEPFFTTKEHGKGTGLGLATVYGIIKQSGGNIYVYSELGRGTVVKIYLPTVSDRISTGKSNPNLRTARHGHETVLLVEDEPAVRAMTRIALEMYGYKVLEASHGEAALSTCAQYSGPIHLLLTDVVMPGMSGRQVVEALRPRYPAMKVLYLSGYTDDAVVRHGVLEAETAFLQKPFTPVVLANKVREVLDS